MSVNRWISAVVTGGLVATTLLAGAAPAGAAAGDRPSRVVLRDGSGDVQRMVPPDTSSHPYGDFPPADVTRAVVAHRTGKVVIRMRFVDLKKAGRQLYWLDIRTSAHDYRATLVSKTGARQGIRTFEVDGTPTKCRGFTRRIDYAQNTVTMRIARSCLANPAWVRVQILNTLEYKSGGPLYIDNPHNHKAMGGPTARLYRSS